MSKILIQYLKNTGDRNQMDLIAIVGSSRKGKATDTLVDKAIEGAKARFENCNVKKIHLADYDIRFCTNCLACRDSQTKGPLARCTIQDDMDRIRKDLLESDYLIFGTPVHMGYATGIMMTFLERICWTFAKPQGKIFTIAGELVKELSENEWVGTNDRRQPVASGFYIYLAEGGGIEETGKIVVIW